MKKHYAKESGSGKYVFPRSTGSKSLDLDNGLLFANGNLVDNDDYTVKETADGMEVDLKDKFLTGVKVIFVK